MLVAANPVQESLLAYLHQSVAWRKQYGDTSHGWPYICIEDLLLQRGRWYTHQAAPYQPFPRACYDRAYDHATRRRSRWIYCEGYGLNPRVPLPTAHAWITRADAPGRAFELAWEDAAGAAYIGIPFRADYVRKVHRASKYKSYSVLDAWWLHYPLLSGETPLESVVCADADLKGGDATTV